MSSLADLPELIGFFSYSREDDEDSGGALSALRERIQRELRGQLGRPIKTFRLQQRKEAIASGEIVEAEIKPAIEHSVFLIPIITPTVARSPYYKCEVNAFLAREAELDRHDLVFPILYKRVPGLEDSVRRQNDPLLSVIASRQYVNWCELRHRDLSSTDVKMAIERFCLYICDALCRPWSMQRFELERRRQQAELKCVGDEATKRAAETRPSERADEGQPSREADEKRRRIADAEGARGVGEERRNPEWRPLPCPGDATRIATTASLADLPELIGFFSYSREDDEDSGGALSAMRERIQRELRGQLGRSMKTFRLWQDKQAIASGKLWEREISTAVAQSVFFIPIITPTVVKSPNCEFELNAFLAREAALGRDDLVFPILYIRVPALEDSVRRQNEPIASLIAKRQYADWCEFRHLDISTTDVLKSVERFCSHIYEALNKPWLSPEDRVRLDV